MENKTDTTKTCKTCKTIKLLESFHKGNNYKGGFRPNCISCTNLKHSQKPRVIELRAKAAEYKKGASKRQRDTYQSKKLDRQAYQKAYQKKNPEASLRGSTKYNNALKARNCLNLTIEEKRRTWAFKLLAATLSERTGTKHVVDHIIPIQGKTISGLHHPDNLQVLTARDNSHKGNSYDGTVDNLGWMDDLEHDVAVFCPTNEELDGLYANRPRKIKDTTNVLRFKPRGKLMLKPVKK